MQECPLTTNQISFSNQMNPRPQETSYLKGDILVNDSSIRNYCTSLLPYLGKALFDILLAEEGGFGEGPGTPPVFSLL